MKRLPLAAVIAILLLFLSAACSTDSTRSADGRAPDFNFNDGSGKTIRLSDLRGKVVMLEFWATWCPPCRASVPALKAVYDRHKGKSFVMLAISVDKGDDAQARVNAFIKEKAVNYPVLIDNDSLSSAYGAMSIPMTFLIDRDGNIAKKHIGLMPDMAENISREIEALL